MNNRNKSTSFAAPQESNSFDRVSSYEIRRNIAMSSLFAIIYLLNKM